MRLLFSGQVKTYGRWGRPKYPRGFEPCGVVWTTQKNPPEMAGLVVQGLDAFDYKLVSGLDCSLVQELFEKLRPSLIATMRCYYAASINSGAPHMNSMSRSVSCHFANLMQR